MSFISDKQTTDELNLLGKYQKDSVYGIFRKTKTQIGDKRLEYMLKHPLKDKNLIEERSNLFQYFQKKNMVFPFDDKQITEFAEWLAEASGRSPIGSFLHTLKQKTTASLLHDEGYQKQMSGLSATVEVLRKCNQFLNENFESSEYFSEHPFSQKLQAVKQIFSEKNIDQLVNHSPAISFSLKEVSFYERLLQNKLSAQMHLLLEFIEETDVSIAVSRTAAENKYTYPVISESKNELLLKNIKHPSLQNAKGNDLYLNEKCNLLFLTGANMAGKSTLMKSIGIAIYLAHCGFPVAADCMRFSIKEGMLSSINIPDNINLGYSHFYAEVLRVKDAATLTSKGHNMVIMFDELFKGTNVKDAFEGTLEVTKAFAKYKNCLFIVSTHIIEVGEKMNNFDNVLFAYMPTIMDDEKPRYTYRLTEGISEDKQGLLIIQNEGIPQLLGLS